MTGPSARVKAGGRGLLLVIGVLLVALPGCLNAPSDRAEIAADGLGTEAVHVDEDIPGHGEAGELEHDGSGDEIHSEDVDDQDGFDDLLHLDSADEHD